MSAYTDELLAHSRNGDLHAEAARVRLARQAAGHGGAPGGPGAVARLVARVRANAPRRAARPGRMTTRTAE